MNTGSSASTVWGTHDLTIQEQIMHLQMAYLWISIVRLHWEGGGGGGGFEENFLTK